MHIYFYDDYFIIESDKYYKPIEDKIKSFGDNSIFHFKDLSWRAFNDIFDCFMDWIKSQPEILFSVERFEADSDNITDSDDDDDDSDSDF